MADVGFDIPQAIVTTAGQYGVDPDLALSVAHAESNLDPSAVSPKGARGVFQLMPDTATGLGVDPHDTHQNIIGGVKYLKQLSDKYGGDRRLTVAAYNAGPGAVDKHGGVPPYPETQAYVDKVVGTDSGALPSADDVEAHIANPGAISEQSLPNLPGYISDPSFAAPPGEEGNPAWQAPGIPLGGPSADDIEKQLGITSAPEAAPTPDLPADPYSQIGGFMSKVNRGLGIGDELAAGAKTAVHALTGELDFHPHIGGGADFDHAVAQDFRANMAGQRQTEAGFQQEHRVIGDLAQGVGMAGSVAVPGFGEGNALRSVALGSRLGNIGRGAVTSALAGSAYAAADAGTPEERLRAASSAATNPVTLALGGAAGALAPTAARAASAARNVNAATLEQAGVPLTVGQAGGQFAHRLEDAAESLPLTGAAIRARRIEGLEGFNRAAINEALDPIGQRVEGHGRDAIAQANQHVSNAYETALQNVATPPDAQYMRDLLNITGDARLPTSVRNDISDFVREYVTDPIASDHTGQAWKRIDSDLNTLRRSASNAVGTTPQSLSLQRALDRVQEAHWGLLERNSPQAANDVAAADAANAAMERVRSAGSTAATAGREGLFTASDLNRAVASKGGRSGRRAYSEGNALMQGLSDAGQAVLPSKVPDSGTALRTFIGRFAGLGGALGGVGALGGHDAAVPAALGSLATDLAGATFYSRPAQNALRGVRLSRLMGTGAPGLPPEAVARLARAVGIYDSAPNGAQPIAPAPNALSGVSLGR